jgi:hypothetical protein
MSALSHDSTGKILSTPLESHSLAIAYNADGTVNTITATDPISASVYVCTFGYVAGSPTTVSGWVKQ